MTADARTMRERYEEVRGRMLAAARKAGTDPKAIVLVAVTKNAEPEQIRELIQLGHADYGENRVQQLLQRAAMIDEWLTRHRTLPGTPWSVGNQLDLFSDGKPKAATPTPGPATNIRWHMIGTLQRNKVKKVAEMCRLIQSVDSLRLAEEIQAISVKREAPIDVLLQVNTSGEASKSGCAPAAAIHLAEQIDTMLNVRLRGVMTIAKYSKNPETARLTFARARDIYHDIQDAGFSEGHCNILSMGMSGDYEVAIEEGSSMVRIGTAIFGEPPADAVESETPESEEREGAEEPTGDAPETDPE